jgi:hypothetical protein
VEVGPNELKCAYCGSAVSQDTGVRCPRCGLDNERGAHYCSQCGLALTKWTSPERPKRDLALISIGATVVGSLFVPVGGAILGLFLAYKAREQARAAGGWSGSEELARIAIAVGWIGLGVSLLPLCLFPVMMGGEMVSSLCGGLMRGW